MTRTFFMQRSDVFNYQLGNGRSINLTKHRLKMTTRTIKKQNIFTSEIYSIYNSCFLHWHVWTNKI